MNYKPRADGRLVDIIERKTALQLRKELGLQLVGTGAGMMDEIRMLALSFQYNNPITPCEGRELSVKAIDIFLATINDCEEIRPYLIQYPFEPKNVEIRIFLHNQDGSAIALGNLSIISATDGVLQYKVNDPATTRLVTAYEETYQEAVDQLTAHSTEPQVLIAPPPENYLDRPGAKFVPGGYHKTSR